MSEDKATTNKNSPELDSGTYEILRSRLLKQEKDLRERMDQLNQARKEVFGSIETKLIATERVTTENNCVPRDMIAIGKHFIFGYNVHIGLKTETVVSDVLSVYEFKDHSFVTKGLDLIGDERFINDFKELYKYYKSTVFERFAVIGPYLFMVFQVGKKPTDIKTFKWVIQGESLIYENNRSDHEYKFPPQFEFEWKRTSRDFHRGGKHPHVSILDKVFIETIGGDLTIKVEDNTNSGEGILSEPVDDVDQRLDDAEMYYADLGNIILLKIRPFNEAEFRHFVYNHKVKTARRMDGIKDSCALLPDNQGIIFSKGYYLQTGEYKAFDNDLQNLKFEKRIASSNGEDFMYVFYSLDQGAYSLLPYNIIQQKVENLIVCHGYSFFPDGEMSYFTSQEEAAKHHAIQIWQTPFVGKDYVPPVSKDSYLFKIGNKDIVKGMAECYEVITLINKEDEGYSNLYLDIVKNTTAILDSYFWIRDAATFNPGEVLEQIRQTASSAIEEFEKVVRIKKNSQEQFSKYQKLTNSLLDRIKRERFETIDTFVKTLAEIRTIRGEVIGLKELRYADLALVEGMEKALSEQGDNVSRSCINFLLQDKALQPYKDKVEHQRNQVDKVAKVADAKKQDEELIQITKELEMLIDIVSNLKIEDATQTTSIIDSISLIFSDLNGVKSALKNKRQSLNRTESTAEFHAQVKLVEQAVVNYLDVADTPEKCDEYLTKLMVQVEELEGKFAEFDEFIETLTEKREEIYDAFESKKIRIVESRNTRASSLMTAAERILKGAQNKLGQFKTAAEINGYFASDLMIDKVRGIVQQLEELNDSVKASDLQSRLKSLKEDTLRQLKDKQELFVEGQNIVKFGPYNFTVNTQPLDLTIVHKDGEMFYHLTGTSFFEKVADAEFEETRPAWEQMSISETSDIYKGEFLAYKLYKQVLAGGSEEAEGLFALTLEKISVLRDEELTVLIQKEMASRYTEGYVKGVHDKDAALLVKNLINIHLSADLLRFSSPARTAGKFVWNHLLPSEKREHLNHCLKGIGIILQVFPETKEFGDIKEDLQKEISDSLQQCYCFPPTLAKEAAEYLFFEVSRGDSFIVSKEAAELMKDFRNFLERKKLKGTFIDSVNKLEKDKDAATEMAFNWLKAFTSGEKIRDKEDFLLEAALLLVSNEESPSVISADLSVEIQGMSGSHNLIDHGKYKLHFNRFIDKLSRYENEREPLYRKYVHLKTVLNERFKEDLRLNEFKPRVLSSFVRNKLIDEVYLPLVGANLAKQMGVAGENKRTDLMGMLLLISPPGYGKTTIMEYIASRLGIIFMKINGPAIGHKVTSLDPVEAPNAAAREEMEKLNLAFEMGDNVMIYLDDIQHCNPEFLQKFISLCDAQRKIEGVYKGRPKTYDFRGKKVCVVMAGNPYTESGDKFQIPDMLANRADTYNLGDIIGDKEDVFKLSYVENCLTSNTALNKLVSRSFKDVYAFLKLCETGDKTGLDFEGSYTAEEANEFVSVLKKLNMVREVILKVNMEYIRSASQADEFRTEPPFKLQGSYRNMNKIAERIVALMNDAEMKTLILSHYENESQTLTKGAEANLLKFKSLVGWMTEKDKQRWEEICHTFRKNQKYRNIDSSNQVAQVVAQLSELGEGVDGIKDAIIKAALEKPSGNGNGGNGYAELLAEIYKGQRGIQEELGRQQALTEAEKKEKKKQEQKLVEDIKTVIKENTSAATVTAPPPLPVQEKKEDTKKLDKLFEKLRKVVQVEVKEKGFLQKDFQEYLTYKLDLQNVSDKNIRGFAGSLVFADLFDHELLTVNITFEEGLKAGKGFSYSIQTLFNKLVDNEAALKDKQLKDLKISWNPRKVIFEDGSEV